MKVLLNWGEEMSFEGCGVKEMLEGEYSSMSKETVIRV